MISLIELFYQVRAKIRGFLMGPPGAPGARGDMGACGAPGKNAADLECPKCFTWVSELSRAELDKSGFTYPSADPVYSQAPFTDFNCGKCGHTSVWFTGAPVLIRADMVTFIKPQADSCNSDKANQ